MSPDGRSFRYRIEWDPTAAIELDEVRAFTSRRILHAVEELYYEAEVESRNRKRLREPVDDVPDASWEVRIGEWRIFYEVKAERIVRVLRVILKGRQTTEEAVRRKP